MDTMWANRVFHKLYEIGNNANIDIRGFATWKQKHPVAKCYPQVGIELGPLIFQVQHSPFWAKWACATFKGSLNFCSCINWFLDFEYLVGINRAWLYKEPKVSVLQANVHLAQKGEC